MNRNEFRPALCEAMQLVPLLKAHIGCSAKHEINGQYVGCIEYIIHQIEAGPPAKTSEWRLMV